jgi:hypothetical protein
LPIQKVKPAMLAAQWWGWVSDRKVLIPSGGHDSGEEFLIGGEIHRDIQA